jgi:hypothetical protein
MVMLGSVAFWLWRTLIRQGISLRQLLALTCAAALPYALVLGSFTENWSNLGVLYLVQLFIVLGAGYWGAWRGKRSKL